MNSETAIRGLTTAERDRLYRQRHPERVAAAARAAAPRRREQRRAHQAVYVAVRSGLLTRRPCEVCNDPKVHAHHPNGYRGHELDVVWLCYRHHKDAHGHDNAACPNGHSRDGNSYLLPDGRRVCRPCNNAATARYKARRRAERLAA